MTNANDSAFARPLGEVTNPGEPAISDESEGLTKREYFAAMAMQGLIAWPTGTQDIAAEAVEHADALIKALNTEAK
jgi:hypothetical protein